MANKIPRVPVREQDPKVRAHNFEEVSYGYNKEEAMLEASRAARFPELVLTRSTPNNVEINHALAHKGEAMRRLAEALGFGLAECMAFGDGLNDLTMVRDAGLGVAMANAAPEVLAAAKFVAPSNDDDGVAAAIGRFLPADA